MIHEYWLLVLFLTLKCAFWCPVCTSKISVVLISMNRHRYSCKMLILPLILMSDVLSLSGISGLSFDSTFLPAFLLFFLPLLLFLSSFFFCCWASLLTISRDVFGFYITAFHIWPACEFKTLQSLKPSQTKVPLKQNMLKRACIWDDLLNSIICVCVKHAFFVFLFVCLETEHI